ncbi:IS3 family transposase [Sporosarcina newyorkensis 2681]|uniref:IS3 family transposase n=1 Tax=Sporosarcina newyorkensis 2681 TaxID=1027292 RepID=F9DNN6_9BACL|nr:hypothetical protein [Sporosarcina newyorkensis]EGQ27529.1 IS3 family transposase [Sporosarcina newyorkensis 2681]
MTLEKNKFAEEYKKQMMLPYENGRSRKEILLKYASNVSNYEKWSNAHGALTSLQDKDFFERTELFNLRKDNQRLLKEMEVLKQAILIMGYRENG